MAVEREIPFRVEAERLADILNIAEDGIVTVNGRHQVVFFNHGASRIFGYSSEEIIGQPLNRLIPVSFHNHHDLLMEEFARSKDVSKLMNQRRAVFGRRQDGAEFPAEITISKSNHTQEILFTAIVRDISDRKQYEETILRLNQDLEERVKVRTAELEERNLQLLQNKEEINRKAEELRNTTQQLWQATRLSGVGELAASIAHELNNPLGTISLRIENVLTQTQENDPRRRSLEIIDQEIHRMARLVANLLSFSRPGRDQVSTVDVCDEIVKTIELTEHHMSRRGIRMEPEFEKSIPLIYADRQQLRQVFLNLFTNAADAMPSGGKLVPRVRTVKESVNPGIVIEVIDTGVGIPEDVLPKVTDPFFSTKEEGKGTGLGLAICRRIIQQHSGNLEIESKVSVGTTIRITLPIRTEANVSNLNKADTI